MNLMLLATRLVLASVFGIAGLAKLFDRTGSRESMREFGVPAALAAPLGLLLPLVELACAGALLFRASAWPGALAALALLSMFVVAIAVNLARGRTPDCHCFGKLHSEPVGWSTVVRNVVLAAVAGFVVWQGPGHAGPGLVGWLNTLGRSDGILLGLSLGVGILAAAMAVMVFQLLAQNGRMMLRIEALEAKLGGRTEPSVAPAGLPVNTQAPAFNLPGLDGMPVALDTLRDLGKPLLLFFSESGCSACDEILPDVGRWQRDYGRNRTHESH